MMNNFVIVARFMELKPAKEYGDDAFLLTLKAPRAYKNADGEYEEDMFDVVLKGNIASNTAEYCSAGDVIGIKGRIESFKYEAKSKKFRRTILVADKVTFLSSHSSGGDE